MTWNRTPDTTPMMTAAAKETAPPLLEGPRKLSIAPKKSPIHSPEPTPEATARPQLIRPVMFSTWRRSVPTIARYWTGKPSSLRESTACCASA